MAEHNSELTKGELTKSEMVTVGRVSGLFGVHGWVKIYSYTEPRENILRYKPWYLKLGAKDLPAQERWLPLQVAAGRIHGKGLVARLEGYDDRDTAAVLVGKEIRVLQSQLPNLAQGEYYWSDLIGLQVVTTEGVRLGVVDHLIETGSNDVFVVRGERERLVPYIPEDVIKSVDLDSGIITVDWDPEF